MQDITGALTIIDPPAFQLISLNDTGDTVGRTITQDTVLIGTDNYGRVTGLAPATILYKYADTSSVLLTAGGGADTVNVLRTGRLFTIGNAAGADTVNLGNSTTGMQDLLANVVVNNPLAYTINFNDAADATGRNFTHTLVTVGGINYSQVTGLAPATIQYRTANGTTATFFPGSGTDTANFTETAPTVGVFYKLSAGFDTVNVNTDAVGSATVNFPDTERLGGAERQCRRAVNMVANGNHVLLTRRWV
jgi:hypothetical protein